MTRILCAAAALVAALSVGCSSGEGGAATPTGPTATSTTSTGGGGSPTTQSCKPATPGNLRVSTTDSRRVFTWDTVSNAQDYFIQIGNAGSDSPDHINTNTSQTTYTWAGAQPANYWARVYARNSCGSSANSEQISFH